MLRELLAAGPDGLPQLLTFDGKWLHELVDNQLVEPFTDCSRILCERYRLTWQGERFARFFDEETANDDLQHLRSAYSRD